MRADLLALTPETLAALANLGLVKRAQREIEQGKAPLIEEDGSGTVTASFEDGVKTQLAAGVVLRDTKCSCGAAGACRHRVAAVLAYQRSSASPSGDPEAASKVTAADDPAKATERWSPGEVTDDALTARLGRKMIDLARQIARRGATVEVQRNAEGQSPVAMLPSCTVRFFVPRDLAYAKCDCARRSDCEHVALAVWAFRKADGIDPEALRLVVDVDAGDDAGFDAGPLEGAIGVIRAVLLDGVSGYHGALAQKFAVARDELEKAGYTWPHVALEDLEEALEAYRSRSSRYRAGTIVELGAELLARRRAATGGGALPARHVLGVGEALETKLDQLKLVGLGARVDGADRDREVEVFFADPDSAAVLVYRKEWAFRPEEPLPEGAALGAKRAMTGVSIGSLARGLVVTRVARRRANRSLFFGESRGGMTSVTGQRGEWGTLSEPLLVPSLSRLEELFRARPPGVLRPRILAEDVHVLSVREVSAPVFSPGLQQLQAVITDQEGSECLLGKPFRSVVPLATDHLAAVLGGRNGAVRYVSGVFRHGHAGLVLEPLGVVADKLVVPDFETGDVPPAVVGVLAGAASQSPVEEAARRGWALLEEGAQVGLRHVPAAFGERLVEKAAELSAAGLSECGRLVATLARSIEQRRSGVAPDADHQAASAFLEAALRLALARERA